MKLCSESPSEASMQLELKDARSLVTSAWTYRNIAAS